MTNPKRGRLSRGGGQSSSTIKGDCMVREGDGEGLPRPVAVHYTVRGRVKYNPSDFEII